MHLNRFTIVWLPIRHQQLWRTRNIQLAIILIFIVSFGLTYQALIVSNILIKVGNYAVPNPATYGEMDFTLDVIRLTSQVYPLLSLVICGGTIFKLVHMRYRKQQYVLDLNIAKKRKKQSRSQSSAKIELNLTFICLATLVNQLGLMGFMFFLGIAESFPIDTRIILLNLVSDVSTISEAWIAILVNRTLR
ncbi:unnamed protein product, partial [Mesorhabditis spiculigera]